jgi:hypothetical protein
MAGDIMMRNLDLSSSFFGALEALPNEATYLVPVNYQILSNYY